MKDITKTYSNGEVSITWQPSLCIHSTKCWKGAEGLREVFNPAEKPWIKPGGASTERIIAQVKKCPSGALGYRMDKEESAGEEVNAESIIEVTANGPLLVYGNITVKDKEGREARRSKVTAFCRCGASGNKPYCDGSHVKTGFKD